jgi:hypothetical protein
LAGRGLAEDDVGGKLKPLQVDVLEVGDLDAGKAGVGHG